MSIPSTESPGIGSPKTVSAAPMTMTMVDARTLTESRARRKPVAAARPISSAVSRNNDIL